MLIVASVWPQCAKHGISSLSDAADGIRQAVRAADTALDVLCLVLDVSAVALSVVREVATLDKLALALRLLTGSVHQLISCWAVCLAAADILSIFSCENHLILKGSLQSTEVGVAIQRLLARG